MSTRIKLSTFALVMVAVVALVTLPAEDTEALAPLGFTWECFKAQCTFTAVTNHHTSFIWLFGDGSDSGRGSYSSISHLYEMGGQVEMDVNVILVGYTTASSSSPDNIVGCVVTVENHTVGGAPPSSGSC